MPDGNREVVYVAAFENVVQALQILDAIERLTPDELTGWCDAAVVDKFNGKTRIVKRVDRPGVRVIPEELGSGTLPRQDLKEAAGHLTAVEAGLIAIGEPAVEEVLGSTIFGAVRVHKLFVDASPEELADELREALNG
jgi:hypothetical protein